MCSSASLYKRVFCFSTALLISSSHVFYVRVCERINGKDTREGTTLEQTNVWKGVYEMYKRETSRTEGEKQMVLMISRCYCSGAIRREMEK